MSDAFLTAIENQPDLLFITSHEAMDQFDIPDPQLQQNVEGILGDRLKYIPSAAQNAFDATVDVRDWLNEGDFKGVVILGNYDTVPSRRMQCTDPDLLYQLIDSDARIGEDRDDWWVWNDDLYASQSPNRLADLPVSRLPIIPERVNSPFAENALTTATCISAAEFPVVDTVFSHHLQGNGGEIQSPPFATEPPPNAPGGYVHQDITQISLAADKLYLMLHGEPRTTIHCWGSQSGSWNPVAIDGDLFQDNWPIDGVIFAGACWGVQIVDLTAREAESGSSFNALPIKNSLPLELINRGANAFVGFTALHHVPDAPETALLLGAPLHEMFWNNIAGDLMGPSEALFQAKAGFVSSMQPDGMHKLAIAQELKALWAASCIGLGW